MNKQGSILLLVAIMFSTFSCGQQQKMFSFNNDQLTYEGRVAFTSDAAVLSWPGTAVYVNFSGTEIKGIFQDSDTANYYNVIIDGTIISKVHFDKERKTYTLAEGLHNGSHRLQLYKRTEWDKGYTLLYGFSGKGLELLAASPKPARSIEFYGNSITCGYAIEDYNTDLSIGFYENNYDSYAALTARHFNAQCNYIAKSGIGITISWFPLLMREMYDRLDPTDSTSKWDFKKFTPQVVVINLLQNDYWLTNMPENPQFKFRFGTQKPTPAFIVGEYQKFVASVRNKYPAAKIICMLGNMNITEEGSQWPGYVTEAVGKLNDKNVFTFFVPYKNTPGHPKTTEQKALADALIGFIEKNISW